MLVDTSALVAIYNFGDCIVYGTAKAKAVKLLFQGSDFTHTDVGRVGLVGEEAP